jgi:hypothetical protein
MFGMVFDAAMVHYHLGHEKIATPDLERFFELLGRAIRLGRTVSEGFPRLRVGLVGKSKSKLI